MLVIYGVNQTRITLYNTDGVTPLYRITLQKESVEGLTLRFKPEGVSHDLGSGADWAKPWTHRGFRPELEISWTHGITSSIETWDSSAWGASESILTALALSRIFTWAFQSPCLVEPHLDKGYSFLAQPDPSKAFEMKDYKGIIHTDLSLLLIAKIVGTVPDWPSL